MSVKHDYTNMATRVKAVDLGKGDIRLDFDCSLGGYAASVSVRLHPEQVQALIRDITGIVPDAVLQVQDTQNANWTNAYTTPRDTDSGPRRNRPPYVGEPMK